MKEQEWSNQELAAKLGVNKTTVNNWRRGNNSISQANLHKLSDLLQVDRQTLLETDAQIAQEILRETIYATRDQPIEPVPVNKLIPIMEALGLTIKVEQNIVVGIEDNREMTQAERGVMETLANAFGSAKSSIEPENNTPSESDD